MVALVRNGVRGDAPPPETRLQAKDVLVLEGSTNETRAAEPEIYRGKR